MLYYLYNIINWFSYEDEKVYEKEKNIKPILKGSTNKLNEELLEYFKKKNIKIE